MSDYKIILVVLLIRCSFICDKEVFANDVIFSQEMVCPENILILKCNLSDTNTVTTMHHMRIQQRNISELYEDVVTMRFQAPNNSQIKWYNDTIKNISSTEGSSIIPANESKLVVQIRVKRFELRDDSMMFRCTIYAESPTSESIQGLTVRKGKIGCPSFAAGQKIQAEYANILVNIIACTTLITIFSD